MEKQKSGKDVYIITIHRRGDVFPWRQKQNICIYRSNDQITIKNKTLHQKIQFNLHLYHHQQQPHLNRKNLKLKNSFPIVYNETHAHYMPVNRLFSPNFHCSSVEWCLVLLVFRDGERAHKNKTTTETQRKNIKGQSTFFLSLFPFARARIQYNFVIIATFHSVLLYNHHPNRAIHRTHIQIHSLT